MSLKHPKASQYVYIYMPYVECLSMEQQSRKRKFADDPGIYDEILQNTESRLMVAWDTCLLSFVQPCHPV